MQCACAMIEGCLPQYKGVEGANAADNNNTQQQQQTDFGKLYAPPQAFTARAQQELKIYRKEVSEGVRVGVRVVL